MQEPEKIVDDLVTFYQKLLIPYMRIRRDLPFPGEPERLETDGEHAFTLAMIAISVNERLKLSLDSGKIAQYALVHDLVEVHAGDVPVRASEATHATKDANEHEAYKVIKHDFAATFPWVHTIIEQYEAKADPESQLVYVVDKYTGSLGWLSSEGKNWSRNYPEKDDPMYDAVFNRLRSKVVKYDQGKLLELFDLMHGRLRKNRSGYWKQPLVVKKQVGVRIGIFIYRDDGKFLLMKRKSSHGSGTWAPPGGNIEFGETIEECAVREVKEETGLNVSNVEQFATTNDIFDEGKHYVTLHLKAMWNGDEPKIMESEKCSELGWFTKDTLPIPLFKSTENLVKDNVDF